MGCGWHRYWWASACGGKSPSWPQVQWLHDPGADGALALHRDREGERDRRIRLACQRLIDVAPAPVAPAEPITAGPVTATAHTEVEVVVEAAAGGVSSQVPPLPPGYVVRDELDALIARLVGVDAGGVVGVTAPAAGVGLQGIGGIGKSVLAIALAHDERIRRRFPEGVYWVTVGEHPDLLAAQLDLLTRAAATRRSRRGRWPRPVSGSGR